MENPRPTLHRRAKPRVPRILRTILFIFLALILLTALVILIVWLSVKPKNLEYTIEEGSVHYYNLANKHLNATFNFVIRAHNPNSKISIYYDKVETSVAYEDQTVASNTLLSFYQPHKNETYLRVKLVAQNVRLDGDVERDLRGEKSSGVVEVDIRMKAQVRLKVGLWKSEHMTLRILCSPTLMPFSSSKGFQRAYCDVNL